jgi:hypothetical protein
LGDDLSDHCWVSTGRQERADASTIAFSLVAEMSTRRLQVKTIALGRASYNVAAIIVNVLTPYMINPTAWVGTFVIGMEEN